MTRAPRRLTRSERYDAILTLLQHAHHAPLRTIATKLQVTTKTARQDLLALERVGYVRVEHGPHRCHAYHFVPP